MSERALTADGLAAALQEEEARLRQLDEEVARTKARVDALREKIANAAAVPIAPVPAGSPGPTSPLEKVRLFRSLFRGREDVYPTRFISKKTGKAGYAPACANKFVPSVCGLPRVKCGDCTNQAFRPVDDGALVPGRRLRQDLIAR